MECYNCELIEKSLVTKNIVYFIIECYNYKYKNKKGDSYGK